MIEPEVAALLEGQVMIVVSTCDSTARAHIGRGSGATFVRALGHIDLFISRTQWPDVARNAIPGAPIAATFVRPDDYRAIQVKGLIREAVPGDAADQQRASRYLADMLARMTDLGVSRLQLSHTLTDRDILRIRFAPTELFSQTPGPGAGARIDTP
jgi:hypothetical protein